MNKQDFLEQLKKELSDLPTSEVDDIIRDQEEFIREAMQAGRDEEKVIQSLGFPRDFAKELKAQLKVEKHLEQAQSEKKLGGQVKSTLNAAFAILVLAPFNLIFFAGPFLGLCGLTFGAWVMAFVFLLVTVLILGVFIFSFVFLTGPLLLHLSTLFGLISAVGGALLSIIVLYYFTQFLMTLTLAYVGWNLKFIKDRA